mgnify:CR=1 FL=1
MPRRKKSKKVPLQPGWVLYLRTSSKDTQNPENSRDRQRHKILATLIEPSDLSLVAEYADIETGTSADRYDYQRMLSDARQGKFSHIAAENAERFGRDDAEALRAIDELHELGIAIRFADYPTLDPVSADDRIMISLSFAMARRESIKISERARGGIHAKLRKGGHSGVAPDGYVNKREDVVGPEQQIIGRTRAWIEPDPVQWQVWRDAWDLLLTDEYTLKEICEILQGRGHTLKTGRPFVKKAPKGKRTHATNRLSDVFHNWFYAGWVVSKSAGIEPKTIRGNWKPVVTTEEFEQGIAILDKRKRKRNPKRKHFYLLRKIIYLQQGKRHLRLSGSTSNINRPTGGNAYYCIPGSDVNIPCEIVDAQIPGLIHKISVDAQYLDPIRQTYRDDIVGLDLRPQSEIERLQAELKKIDDEEMNAARALAKGRMSDDVWDALWSGWNERRNAIQANIAQLSHSAETSLRNLDDALMLLDQLAQLYGTLSKDEQQKLLSFIIKKVVVNEDGEIVCVELHPPLLLSHKGL